MEKEKHKLEIDKLELEHKHQLELQQKQFSQGMNATDKFSVVEQAYICVLLYKILH